MITSSSSTLDYGIDTMAELPVLSTTDARWPHLLRASACAKLRTWKSPVE
ncbi:MAG TPA: hypothetical protein VFW87_23055 [Pirellulales bacterium]|nr:hypothetical protein [Pirellulales bacterium]